MIEAVIKNPTLFKNIIDAVKDIITDGPFYFLENSVRLKALNQSQVALALLNLDPEFFATYQCDRPIIVGINLLGLYKIFKCTKAEDSCTIRYLDDSEFIEFIFESKTGRHQQASLKIINRNYEDLIIPDQIYSSLIDMPSMEFQKICRDIASFSDTLTLEITNSSLNRLDILRHIKLHMSKKIATMMTKIVRK